MLFQWLSSELSRLNDNEIFALYIGILQFRFLGKDLNFMKNPTFQDLITILDKNPYSRLLSNGNVSKCYDRVIEFINKFFELNDDFKNSIYRNYILEEIEAKFYNIFKNVYVKNLKLNSLDDKIEKVLPKFLDDLSNRKIHIADSTLIGTISIPEFEIENYFPKIDHYKLVQQLLYSGITPFGYGIYLVFPKPVIEKDFINYLKLRFLFDIQRIEKLSINELIEILLKYSTSNYAKTNDMYIVNTRIEDINTNIVLLTKFSDRILKIDDVDEILNSFKKFEYSNFKILICKDVENSEVFNKLGLFNIQLLTYDNKLELFSRLVRFFTRIGLIN